MKTIIKIIFFVKLFCFTMYSNTFANIKEDIIPSSPENTVVNSYEGEEFLYSMFEYIRDSIFGLLALITITVFIFIGGRLIMARGNSEEFKKALMHFIYSIIGLAIIALSWAVVKIISSLNL